MSDAYRMLARSDAGGYVRVDLSAVHAHECGYWRFGTRHKPCSCDALVLLEKVMADFSVKVPCPACGVEAVAVDLLPDVRAFVAHKEPSGRYTCRGDNSTPVRSYEAEGAA